MTLDLWFRPFDVSNFYILIPNYSHLFEILPLSDLLCQATLINKTEDSRPSVKACKCLKNGLEINRISNKTKRDKNARSGE